MHPDSLSPLFPVRRKHPVRSPRRPQARPVRATGSRNTAVPWPPAPFPLLLADSPTHRPPTEADRGGPELMLDM